MKRPTQLAVLLAITIGVATALWPASAQAQGRIVRGRAVVFVGGYAYDPFFYDPFFSPWYPFPYGYYPYAYYPRFAAPESDVRLLVTPNNAEVYVDGYYAGVVDDFDGFFQRLRTPPGQHEITLRLEGYRTVHQRLFLRPDSTYKLRYKMEKLGPGETTEPPPVPPTPQAPPPPGGAPYGGTPPYGGAPPARVPPAPMPPRRMPPPGPPAEAGASATLSIRVQPEGAEVLIDGERWEGPEGDARLLVQVGEGPHRVEVQKSGYRRFTTEVHARRGETIPLNVSLTPEREQ